MLHRSHLLLIPLGAMALIALAGCMPTDSGPTPATNNPTVAASASPSATPVPSASATASEIDGIPMTIGCNELVPAQTMYDYNPNYSLKSNYTPAPGSLAARVAQQRGVACAWVNQTSGELIELAVANLPADHSTRLKNDLVTSSKSVPTYNVEGYFTVNSGVGEAQAFADPYWIVSTSKAYFEPGDAAPIMAAAITSLGR